MAERRKKIASLTRQAWSSLGEDARAWVSWTPQGESLLAGSKREPEPLFEASINKMEEKFGLEKNSVFEVVSSLGQGGIAGWISGNLGKFSKLGICQKCRGKVVVRSQPIYLRQEPRYAMINMAVQVYNCRCGEISSPSCKTVMTMLKFGLRKEEKFTGAMTVVSLGGALQASIVI